MAKDDDRRIGRLLARGYAVWQARTYDALAQEGFADIRAAHSPVFRLVGAQGARVSDLAAAARMTKQSMAYLVDGLERAGYVSISADPDDRRAKRVMLTERGSAADAALARLSRGLETELAELIGEKGREDFRRFLQHLVSDMGGGPAPNEPPEL